MESPGSIIQGIYRDRLFDASKQPKFDSGWKSNTIMASFHVLLARLVLHDQDLFKYQGGYLAMRLGAGDKAWDTLDGPPSPKPGEENIVAPYADFLLKENEGLEWAYLDNQQNERKKSEYSPLVRITATITPNAPLVKVVCPLREFALYLCLQGLPRAENARQEFIINHVRHALISKAPEDTLIRQIQFTF